MKCFWDVATFFRTSEGLIAEYEGNPFSRLEALYWKRGAMNWTIRLLLSKAMRIKSVAAV